MGCLDVVTRGIAFLNQRVFTVSTDCHLFALNAANGQVVWRTDTLAKHTSGYVCEGPPTVTNRFVIVGNAGGEQSDRRSTRVYLCFRSEVRPPGLAIFYRP